MSVLYVRDPDTGKFIPMNSIKGADGVSPTIEITEIKGGHRVTVTDANGVKSFDVLDGEGGGGDIDLENVVLKPEVITAADGVVLVLDDSGTEDWRHLGGRMEPPDDGMIPVYGLDGALSVGTPFEDNHAVNKAYLDEKLSGIEGAFDELHTYAQALVNGGAEE